MVARVDDFPGKEEHTGFEEKLFAVICFRGFKIFKIICFTIILKTIMYIFFYLTQLSQYTQISPKETLVTVLKIKYIHIYSNLEGKKILNCCIIL